MYVIFATGAKRDLAEELGCAFTDEDDMNVTIRTTVKDLYTTDAMDRVEVRQAIISAGDGTAAALNILTKGKGEHFHDFETPADVGEHYSALAE